MSKKGGKKLLRGGKKLLIWKIWILSFHLHQKLAKNLQNSLRYLFSKSGDTCFFSKKKQIRKITVASFKKSIFSKFLKLSGDGSYRIWTGLGVLFRPPNRFITPQVVFQKSLFFVQKMRFF